MPTERRWLGNLLLTLTAAIWGTAFVFQRVGMEDLGPLTFTSARMLLGAAAVGLVCLLRRRGKSAPQTRRVNLTGGVCCGLFLCVASLLQQYGIQTTTAGKAGFLTAMYILLVPVFSLLLFHRKSSRVVWLFVLLGLVGMYLLSVREGFSLARGDLLISLCAVCFAGHILCCDFFSRRGDPVVISAIQFLTVGVLSAPPALLLEAPGVSAFRAAALPILYCGLMSCGVAYTLQLVAQKMTEPTVASLLMSLESVFALLAGALLLHERMSPREIAGCALLFTAIILVQLPERRARE